MNILSGDALTSFPIASQETARRFSQKMRSRKISQFMLDTQMAQANESFTSPRMAYTGTNFKTLLAAASEEEGAPLMATIGRMSNRNANRSNIWATIGRGKDEVDGDDNGPQFDARSTEYQIGYDRRVGGSTWSECHSAKAMAT